MSHLVCVAVSCLSLSGPARPWNERPAVLSRRAAVTTAASATLAFAATAAPVQAVTLAGVSPSKMLTIGQYLNDVRSARAGILELKPLLEKGTSGYEQVRVELRKPPANGIRKAASKVLIQLDGTELYAEKNEQYESIKLSLAALDNGCRPASAALPGAMVAEADKLASLLEDFGRGFPVKYAEPQQ